MWSDEQESKGNKWNRLRGVLVTRTNRVYMYKLLKYLNKSFCCDVCRESFYYTRFIKIMTDIHLFM